MTSRGTQWNGWIRAVPCRRPTQRSQAPGRRGRPSAPAAGAATRAASRRHTCRATWGSCPWTWPRTSCAFARATRSRARCWRSARPATRRCPRWGATSTSAPTCPPTASTAMACWGGGGTVRRGGGDMDIRTDVPAYRVYRDGVLVGEVDDLKALWRDDFVAFVLGCSFSFEHGLIEAGIPLRHVDEGKNVAMYRTNIQTVPAGPFHGPMVVSMRPMKA